MTVCIYRYIHTTALCYWPNTTGMPHLKTMKTYWHLETAEILWGISQLHTLAVRRASQVLNLINCRIVSRSMVVASWQSVTQNWLYFCAETLQPCNCRSPLPLSASAITSPAYPIILVWSAIGFEFIRTCQSDCGKCQLCCVDTRGARGQRVSGHGTPWAAWHLPCASTLCLS